MQENVKKSQIKAYNGNPTLFVNDLPTAGAAYITYLTEKNRYGDFAEVGYRLFSVPLYFATRSINVVTQIPPFQDGIFEVEGRPDFSIVDREIKRVLDACPDAWIFPRVNMNLPKWWDRAHPDELCDTAAGPEKCVCFSSDVWAEATENFLKQFLEHVENSDYAGHIVAYQLAAGNTEEWFSLDSKGSVGKRAYEKFAEYVAKGEVEDNEKGFQNFLSIIAADRLRQFARFAKSLLPRTLAIGGFYGYTMECFFSAANHAAIRRILNGDEVDFICSPVSYSQGRALGRDLPNMLLPDSLALHNKLYFAENDIRTDLTCPPNDMPVYNTPIWYGPDRKTSLETIKMAFARALCHNHAFWWFDMWGGWYADKDFLDLMGKMRQICEKSLGNGGKYKAQVAVFVDERDATDSNVNGMLCYNIREALGLAGTPYAIFLADDFDKVSSEFDAYVFVVPSPNSSVYLPAKSATKPYIIIDKENAAIKPSKLRDFYRSAGVKIVCDRDCVVYENESYLFLHTTETGEYVLNCQCELKDAFNGKTFNTPILAEAKHGYLFEKIK